MKYRLSPFHVLSGLMLVTLVLYFIFPIGDEHGWGRSFSLFFAPIGIGILLGVDLLIQYLFKSKKYKNVILIELVLIAIVMLLQVYNYYENNKLKNEPIYKVGYPVPS